MKKSKVIALSAMTCAISVIFLVLGAYFPVLDMSALLMASIMVMLPLAKKTYLGAFLVVLSTALIALLISGFRYQIVLPYVLFFGFHPIVNYWTSEKHFKKWVVWLVEDVWFVLCLVLMQFLSEVLVIDIEQIKNFVYPILIIGGAIMFLVYNWIFQRMQNYMNAIVVRLKL